MSDDKLVHMANAIATFFKPYGVEKSIAGVRHHIVAFWTPRMRTDIAGQIASGKAAGLDPVVVEALREPAPATAPTQRESAGPEVLGEIGASDTG